MKKNYIEPTLHSLNINTLRMFAGSNDPKFVNLDNGPALDGGDGSYSQDAKGGIDMGW